GRANIKYDEADQVKTVTKSAFDCVPTVPTVIATQVSSYIYDKLGRLIILNEPERGKMWFGSHDVGSDTVSPDGYDALGNVIRYQDASGALDLGYYYYHATYDAVGRVRTVDRDVTQGTGAGIYHMAFLTYDMNERGTGSLARLGQKVSYDDN